jgi:hypothetical protein
MFSTRAEKFPYKAQFTMWASILFPLSRRLAAAKYLETRPRSRTLLDCK